MQIELKFTNDEDQSNFNVGQLLEVRVVDRSPKAGYIIVEIDEDLFFRFAPKKDSRGLDI